MSKHTPGPWSQFVWNKDFPMIRTIGAPCGEGGENDHLCAGEMSVADACLIAAAPELLQALKILNHHAKIEDVDRLIAKAEGNEYKDPNEGMEGSNP